LSGRNFGEKIKDIKKGVFRKLCCVMCSGTLYTSLLMLQQNPCCADWLKLINAE
jgi:hypothetical protein